MKTKRLQKLLAAFLSAAMLTSLLAVPAGASDGDSTTSEEITFPKTWDFTSDSFDNTNQGDYSPV